METYTQEQLQWLYTNNPDEYNRYVLAYQAAMAQQQAAQPAAQPVAQAAPVAQTNTADALVNIANMAAEIEDHAEIRAGSMAREGLAWLRLLSYIEIGVHPKKNPMHSPSMVAICEFELHHPDHMTDYDGVRKPRTITVRVPKTHGNNSGFPKFFKSLQRAMGDQFHHIGQMLGQCCLGEIIHNKDAAGKTWENLDRDGAWSFTSAQYRNPNTNQVEVVNIPPLYGTPLLFLMENKNVLEQPQAMKAMWDSIYIPGTRKVGGGTTGKPETEASLNYYQEQIMKSLNWETSQAKTVLDAQGCVTMTDAISRDKHKANEAPQAAITGAMNALPTGLPAMSPIGVQTAQQSPVAQQPAPTFQQQQPLAATVAANGLPPAQSGVQNVPSVLNATPFQQMSTPLVPAQTVAPVVQEAAPVQVTPPQQMAMPQGMPMGMPQGMPQATPSAMAGLPEAAPVVQQPAPAGMMVDPAAFMAQYGQ